MAFKSIPCREALEFVADAGPDMNLLPQWVSGHIASCDSCSTTYREISQLRLLLRSSGEDGARGVPVGSVRQAVLDRLKDEQGRRAPRVWNWPAALATAATILLVLGTSVAYRAWQTKSSTPGSASHVVRAQPEPLGPEPRPGFAPKPAKPEFETRNTPMTLRTEGKPLREAAPSRSPVRKASREPEIRPRKTAEGVTIAWEDTGQDRYRVLKSHRPNDFTQAEVIEVAGTQWTDRQKTAGVLVTYYLVEESPDRR